MVERVGDIVRDAKRRPEDAILGTGERLHEGLKRRGFSTLNVLIDGETVGEQTTAVRRRVGALYDIDRKVKALTGSSLFDSQVDDLPSDGNEQVLGQHDPNRDAEPFHEMLVRQALADDEKLKLLAHVSMHEGFHKLAWNSARGRGETQPIVDHDLEEILCEVRTSMETGKIRAYKQFLPLLDSVVRASGKSREALAEMYAEGRFSEINACYMAAFPEKFMPQYLGVSEGVVATS